MAPAEAFFSTPEMVSVFSGDNQVRQMLAFEAALARAEARAGVIPSAAADAIAAACQVDNFDLGALFRDAVPAGTLAIPLVRQLGQRVRGDGGGSKYVHWGATSQDAIDTGMVLQVREALFLLDAGLVQLGSLCADLAERHRRSIMPGRTLLQQALPITFSLKAARWLGLVARQLSQLRDLRPRVLVLQFGGAAGTLASLGSDGLAVTEFLAQELGLTPPDMPWHAERDRVASLAGFLGVLAGGMAKIAGDVVLMAQTEVMEVAEAAAPGKGGSSTLPQKRNPVYAIEAIAAARLAIGLVPVIMAATHQEHERAAGGWQAEWSALPDLFRWTAGAVERVHAALDGLEVFPERMRSNLDEMSLSESLSMALAAHVGKEQAHSVIQAISKRAVSTGKRLRDVALHDETVRSALDEAAIERALQPENYLGCADAFIDRSLSAWRKSAG
jgi:3-carboxy-cis,cis-muconate cycloisomerase